MLSPPKYREKAGDLPMRSFIAIPLSEKTRAALGKCRDALKSSDGNIKWVEDENFHITMRFLGEITSSTAAAVTEGIQDIASGTKSFGISLQGIGAFPSFRRPKVLWTGVTAGREELKKVHGKVDSLIKTLGFEGNERFVPHVTIGRVRAPAHLEVLVPECKKIQKIGEEMVQGISLMESILTPQGPKYSELAYFKFRK